MLKKQKGITLIALIITIIVMLILVGVTINVAINGGLFDATRDAAMKTEKQSILERIISMAVWNEEGKIEVKATVDKVKQEFDNATTEPATVTDETKQVIVTITGKYGEYKYKITTTEIVEENGSVPPPGDDPQALSELERYLFNADGTGKTVPMVMENNNTLGPIITFNNDSDTIVDAETTVRYMRNIINEDGTVSGIIEYKGADYKFEFSVLGENNYQTTLGNDNEKVTRLPDETYPEGTTEDEIKIKQYFLGYSGEGKSLGNLVDIERTFEQGENPTNIILKDNEIINASTDLIVPAIDFGSNESFEVTYNQNKYIINYEQDENFGMLIATSVIDLSNMADIDRLKLYFKDITTEEIYMNILQGEGDIIETVELVDTVVLKFKSNDYIPDASESLFFVLVNFEDTDIKIEYNNITYKMILDGEKWDFEEIYRPDENNLLRKYVQYDGKKWVVLYDDNSHGLQIVSANILEPNQIVLGINDNIVNWLDPTVKEEADTDDDGELSEEERGIYSHNNVIKSLNDKCYSLVTPKEGVILDVRCFGSNPILGSKYSESGIDETGYNSRLKGGDDNYVDDVNQFLDLYIPNMSICENLFLASRIVDQSGYYGLRTGLNSGWVGLHSYNPEGGVLPVIMLAEGALNNARGSGTPTDPLILE